MDFLRLSFYPDKRAAGRANGTPLRERGRRRRRRRRRRLGGCGSSSIGERRSRHRTRIVDWPQAATECCHCVHCHCAVCTEAEWQCAAAATGLTAAVHLPYLSLRRASRTCIKRSDNRPGRAALGAHGLFSSGNLNREQTERSPPTVPLRLSGVGQTTAQLRLRERGVCCAV